MIKVYIAGPYSKGNIAANVKRAMDAANELIDLGYAPYVPHLTFFLDMNCEKPYQKWLELDNAYVAVCDALLRLPGESSGADKEQELAASLNIPIFFTIADLLKGIIPTPPH